MGEGGLVALQSLSTVKKGTSPFNSQSNEALSKFFRQLLLYEVTWLKNKIYIEYSNFNYLFYGLCDSEVILKESGHNLSFSVKSEVSTRGEPPHIRNNNIRI